MLACLPALAAAPAAAATATATHWLCGLSSEMTQLVCVAEPSLTPAVQAESRPETTAVVNGTRFPLDPARVYTVNFWSPATDLAFVELLAKSTICYRSKDCEVSFSAPAYWRSLHAAAGR